MKIGLAIAPTKASPLAFVVFREDLKVSIKKVSQLGYDGIELALKDAREVNVAEIKDLISAYGLELPVISTGRVFSEARVWFTHPNEKVRRGAINTIKRMAELAEQLGANVNIGRVRGCIPENEDKVAVRERFFSAMSECADFASEHGVKLLLEPINRYETNFINNVAEGLEILHQLDKENVKLMPDVFHMNMEDASITDSLREAGDSISYIHFADSNRWAPGQGHLNFSEIIGVLKSIPYDGFVTVEMLPKPDPDSAARMAIDYLRKIIRELPLSGVSKENIMDKGEKNE